MQISLVQHRLAVIAVLTLLISIFLCPALTFALDDPKILALLKKGAAVQSLHCDYRSAYGTVDESGWKKGTLDYLAPDKRRLVTLSPAGLRDTITQSGDDEWHDQYGTFIYLSHWKPHAPLHVPLPIASFNDRSVGTRPYLTAPIIERATVGEERVVEGRRCVELVSGPQRFCLDMESGFIDEQSSGAFHELFENCRIEPRQDPALFDFNPPEGAHVTEQTVDRHPRDERHYDVPYRQLSLSPQQTAERDDVIAGLIQRRRAVEDFAAVVETESHSGATTTYQGKSVPLVVHVKGELIQQGDDKLKFTYQAQETPIGPPLQGSIVTDGVTRWTAEPSAPGKVSTITKVDVVKYRELQAAMLKRLSALGAAKSGWRPDDMLPGSYKPPALLINPFALIPATEWEVQGEDDIDGIKSYKLVAKRTATRPETTLWIGSADGIGRRGLIRSAPLSYDEFHLREVKVNQSPPASAFQVSGMPVYDMTPMLPAMFQGIGNSFDTPPEQTYALFFETPRDQISSLKGSGVQWMGYDFYLRFTHMGDVELKEPKHLPALTDTKEAIEFFKRAFPDDAEALTDSAHLALKGRSDPAKGIWLLKNSRTGDYFFRAWEAH